jgi:hypothetical protein
MTRLLSFRMAARLAAFAVVALATTSAQGDDKPAPRPIDETKKRLESPTKNLVNDSAPVAPNPTSAVPDRRKMEIERPTEEMLKTLTEAVNKTDGFVNPKVQPGKVKWHKDFAAASAAAKKSGKPVLLFQMLGKLDDQFC